MTDQKNCLFSQSCINLVLRKSDHFISGFPGKIVFGKTTPLGYKAEQFFEFEVFQLYSLYLAIFDIIESFSKNQTLSSKLLLTKTDNLNYIFSVKTLTNSIEDYQVAYFAIELDSEISFNIVFNSSEFQTFLFTLVKIIPSSLCLHSTEVAIFHLAARQSAKIIHDFQEESNSKEFIIQFLKDSNNLHNKSLTDLSTFLNYYCEIILVFHKLNDLVNSMPSQIFDNIASIISKVSKN